MASFSNYTVRKATKQDAEQCSMLLHKGMPTNGQMDSIKSGIKEEPFEHHVLVNEGNRIVAYINTKINRVSNTCEVVSISCSREFPAEDQNHHEIVAKAATFIGKESGSREIKVNVKPSEADTWEKAGFGEYSSSKTNSKMIELAYKY